MIVVLHMCVFFCCCLLYSSVHFSLLLDHSCGHNQLLGVLQHLCSICTLCASYGNDVSLTHAHSLARTHAHAKSYSVYKNCPLSELRGVARAYFFQIRESRDNFHITIYLTMGNTDCVYSPNSIIINTNIILIC